MQTVKKSLEEQQHKTDDAWKGVTQKQQKGTANRYRSLKKPGRLQRRIPKNEKHEMEVEIEKVAKAQKKVLSAVEIADRGEQIAHNKKAGQRPARFVRKLIRRESGS